MPDLYEFIAFVSEKSGVKNRSLVEKDLLIHKILNIIFSSEYFAENYVFKGGSCLVKCYFGYYRFSVDLDFTWKDQKVWKNLGKHELRRRLNEEIKRFGSFLEKIGKGADLDFKSDLKDRKYVEFGSGSRMVTLKMWKNLELVKIQISFVDETLFAPKTRVVKTLLDGVTASKEDSVPFVPKIAHGRTFFSYGRTFYKAATMRLYGRVHIDRSNTFVLNEADFEGLFEIARTCRVPLHTASRSSIGSSMSSLQFYQAVKDEVLIPRNKSIPEAFKSAYDLLVGDRGGFVYEPVVGIHEGIGEVDFSSMYPVLMVRNNISAETVLCKCCPNSRRRIPELNYPICERRKGIVPKALELVVSKRLKYKRMKGEAQDPALKEVYDKRQAALKWILVTCFGYLGYRNAKFGTVDGHMGVCAFGRDAFLRAARMAEVRGFTVIHGIVDSLWLRKENATITEYADLCKEVTEEIDVPLNFEGRYKWIVFLPSKMHPNIGVLNRYYGVMENGKVKVRGIEVRRRDTPRFVYNAQMEMIEVLATANDSKQFMQKIPAALKVIKEYRQRLLDGDVAIWDLIVTKHLSKHPKRYKQRVSQVIAAEQLMKEGAEVHAGKNIRFLFTNAEDKRHERRVKAEQLIENGVNPDTRKYLLLLYASAASLLSFSGYTPKTVYDAIRGYCRKKITDY
jgi:hypothetical protein